jgi:DNA-binding GntR family transcriptional regulator
MAESQFKFVTRKRLSEQVYVQLKEAIILQKIPQLQMGQKISEIEISKMLGCSTTPIREALNMLRKDNLIVGSSFRVSAVVSFSIKEIQDLIYVRATLEVAALKQAMENITTEDIAFLRENLSNYTLAFASCDFMQISAVNKEFHDRFIVRANNLFLERMIDSIAAQSAMVRSPLVTKIHAMRRTAQPSAVGEHAMLVDALEKKDTDKACAILQQHIERTSREIYDYYAQQNRTKEYYQANSNQREQ